MQTMSECWRHTCLPHLEQRDRHFRSFLRSHKVHRALLFNEAPFPARVTFLSLVAEICATGCTSSVIPHSSFPRQINFFFLCKKLLLSLVVLKFTFNYKVFSTKLYAHEMFGSREFTTIFRGAPKSICGSLS